ncbi:MAG: tryptophan--tRNA ligase [Sphingomonadales bacterium]|nr:tryptophan--tRNA ligase [Sphingomonadales bacterium]PIX67641.1 MAG: tryptophan--tRNA ligase [Sphingomonadales bacterium CG_4_10_14_3_um_filter_58_15]NCO49707.1 tryptophan--tRNA ligase [Sphingomonadales bacterium]NCP01012.1 tryptophan--tRNA ligase [Sphingomonadales bacterium]NCP25617.1 tryptophan--tRNA ligase [Sphingomonadales bacterium]
MRTVSGIQPTGNLHLGNYLGAIKNWVKMQDEGECLFFLADLHAITVHNDPAELAANCREMVAALVAAGVDPDKSILFNQARVPAHAELAWMLICNTPMGWLDRMTQFKEKSGKHKQRASLGLYGYPVLQAADVLVYQATHVPVGEDQKQHLELARDIASKFNSDTGTETFTLPEPFIGKSAARIMSLRDGNAKMSKSDPSDLSRINMSDDDETIARKFKKAKTDPEPLPDNLADLADRPEARNLIGIYAAIADQSQEAVLAEYAGKGFGDFKPALADLAVSTLSPIRQRFEELRKDTAAIDAILRDGSEKASAMARPTVEAAYAALGLLRN